MAPPPPFPAFRNSPDYQVQMSFGTPPQPVNLTVDTGSYSLLIGSSSLPELANSSTFEPSQSSTSRMQPDSWQCRNYPQALCNAASASNQCFNSYGDGSYCCFGWMSDVMPQLPNAPRVSIGTSSLQGNRYPAQPQ